MCVCVSAMLRVVLWQLDLEQGTGFHDMILVKLQLRREACQKASAMSECNSSEKA